ncbi:MAG TPA: O-antigen ligase family protein [Bryobacteraceae bacterium]|nr:O-antigen ligase family protein [Bryobacteraceae bacterium]
MTLLLALLLVLIPLAIAPGRLFYFDVTPKIVVLLLGTAAAAVWWAAQSRPGIYRASREARWFLVALGGMAASLVISTVASVDPALSIGGSSWRYWGLIAQSATLVFVCLVAVCCAGQPAQLRLLLRVIAVGSLVVAGYGMAQYFGWDPLLDPRGYHAGEGIFTIVRPPSTLGHADYSANWLLYAVFANAALAASERQTIWKRTAWVAAAASCVAIVLSGSRAALAGLMAGAGILLFWYGLRFTRRTVLIALGCIVATAMFYVSPAGASLRARAHWALEEPAGGARLLLWRDTLRMAVGRWPLGYGPETFIASFALHQSAGLSRAYPDFYHESPHNVVLDALVSQGIAGPALLLALAATGFAAAWRERRTPAAGALAAGLAAMTLSEQFTCFTLPTALAYFTTITMLVSLTVHETPSVRPALWLRVATVPFAAVLVFCGVRLYVAESELAAVRRDLDAARIGDAARHYAAYEKSRWPGAGADLWYSRRLAQIAGGDAQRTLRVEAFQRAGLAAQRATHSTEAAFNAYYNLAAFYARTDDFPRTEQSLRAAIGCAPNWFKTHWMLAQVLEAASRLHEAESEAAAAVRLDGGKHPEVTGTLAHIQGAIRAKSLEPLHK